MFLIRQLIKNWLFILAACAGAVLLYFNQEKIYVHIPGLGEFKVVTAIAFIIAFLAGATFVTVHFIVDVVRKSLELRRYHKKIRNLENELDSLRSQAAQIASNKPRSQSSEESLQTESEQFQS